MNCTALHHTEMCLGDLSKNLHFFTSVLGFRVVATRDTPSCSQKVLKQQNTILVLTQRKGGDGQPDDHHATAVGRQADPADEEHFTAFCCADSARHTTDSVFNTAVVVKNVHEITERAKKAGGKVIRQPTVVSDKLGDVTYSIIATGFGHCVHTLINKTNYKGKFLPGFTDSELQEPEPTVGPHKDALSPLTTYVDHIAYVVEEGMSPAVIKWYGHVFGMKRFIINREDDMENGLEIKASVGMRLRAMEYWRCSETGLYIPTTAGDTSFKIVLSEPITSIGPNHVSKFLTLHKGPSIEHMAFHAPRILHSVLYLGKMGVLFREPPPEYYSHVGKRAELEQVGLGDEAQLLEKAGVLLDTEADPGVSNDDGIKDRYLLQIFSEPIFEPFSFFMELIHREGAQGFGVGNVTALAQSIALQEQVSNA